MRTIIYAIYVYFLGKRFLVCAEYLSKTVISGLISLIKTYLRMAFNEAKFFYAILSIPFRNGRAKAFQNASR